MKKLLFLFIFVILICRISWMLSHSDGLSFHQIHNGDSIGASNFKYKISSPSVHSMYTYDLKILNIKTNKETEVAFDLSNNFEVSEVNRGRHLFIITSTHSIGSGEYDDHQVLKVEGNNLTSIANKTTCDQNVKIEENKLIFGAHGFHCDPFKSFGEDAEFASSIVELT
jgi:hypothetical protein